MKATSAAIITGRNHHSVGFGVVGEMAAILKFISSDHLYGEQTFFGQRYIREREPIFSGAEAMAAGAKFEGLNFSSLPFAAFSPFVYVRASNADQAGQHSKSFDSRNGMKDRQEALDGAGQCLECPMRNVIFASTSIAAALSAVVYCVPVSSAAAANFASPLPKNSSAVVKVNHRRYGYPGYYPYYPPYPAYGPYYYGPPVAAYPPPVVYYPGPRYYPGPAVYGPDGVYIVRRPYRAYDADW